MSAETYIFAPAPVVTVPVAGDSRLFPVRRIFCVGRNYAAHAREMGADPDREPPFFFCKPADAIVPIATGSVGRVAYPPATQNLHHEVELVVAISKGGADIPVSLALEHVFGHAIGLDLTRRDLQNALKSKGHPWEMGKAFDQSAPISPIRVASSENNEFADGEIWLEVNAVRKQTGALSDMIWSIAETISHLSSQVALAPGDLIFTGTPEGVGPLQRGDRLRAGISGLGELQAEIV